MAGLFQPSLELIYLNRATGASRSSSLGCQESRYYALSPWRRGCTVLKAQVRIKKIIKSIKVTRRTIIIMKNMNKGGGCIVAAWQSITYVKPENLNNTIIMITLGKKTFFFLWWRKKTRNVIFLSIFFWLYVIYIPSTVGRGRVNSDIPHGWGKISWKSSKAHTHSKLNLHSDFSPHFDALPAIIFNTSLFLSTILFFLPARPMNTSLDAGWSWISWLVRIHFRSILNSPAIHSSGLLFTT